jgi:uncharacterized metal-binding protein
MILTHHTLFSPTIIQISTMLVLTKVYLTIVRTTMAGTMVLVVSTVSMVDFQACMVASVATQVYMGVLVDFMGDLVGSMDLSLPDSVAQGLQNQTTRKTRKTRNIIRRPKQIKSLQQKVKKHIENIQCWYIDLQ